MRPSVPKSILETKQGVSSAPMGLTQGIVLCLYGMKLRMRFKSRPIELEAFLWRKNGDHPEDGKETFQSPANGEVYLCEGKVVRYYRHPRDEAERLCQYCGAKMHVHGWIDTQEGGHIVCPGDWIVTGLVGERYPVKPAIMLKKYEMIENMDDNPEADLKRILGGIDNSAK